MADISELYPFIRLHAKNAPEMTMSLAIKHATREFCRKTWWHRRTLEVQAIAGQAYYVLTPPQENEDIIGVVSVEYGAGNYILSPDQREYWTYTSGVVKSFAFEPPSNLQLLPYPSSNETNPPLMLVRTANCIKLDSPTIPDEIVRKHDQTVSMGAIGYLCSMPSEGWTNPKIAEDSKREFNMGMLSAKSEAIFGHTPRNLNMVLPRFSF
jgi:hypothetical protein